MKNSAGTMDAAPENRKNKLKKRLSELPRFPLVFQGALLLLVNGLALLARPQDPAAAEVAAPAPALAVWDFLVLFAAATILILLLLRWRLGSKAFSALFMLAVFLGAAALGFGLAGDAGAVVVFSVSIALFYLVKRVWSFDLVLVLGLAGVALNLGQAMHPLSAAIILTVLSFYDVLAVYGSRHMVRMAKTLSEGGAAFAVLLPLKPSGLNAPVKQVKPGEGVFLLGTGDLVLPAIMAVAATGLGLIYGIAATLGALVGLTLNLVIFFTQKKPRPMPALPAPAAGAILAFLVASLIS
jgi:presenilin-like A22 family membrane protease